MRIRTVAKEGALAALAASRTGVHGRERDYELESAKAEVARLSEALKEMAVKRTLAEGKGGWGRVAGSRAESTRPPRRGCWTCSLDALSAGWSIRRACHTLELDERRAHRWYGRRAGDWLRDRKPGGTRVHGLLPEEAEQILALFEERGETDPSHRKLAHAAPTWPGCGVSPSSVRRVLVLADKAFSALPRAGRSVRKQFPDWVQGGPNSIWISDSTHFSACGMAVLLMEDLVSRKWITEMVSSEETATQVELAFTVRAGARRAAGAGPGTARRRPGGRHVRAEAVGQALSGPFHRQVLPGQQVSPQRGDSRP